jgi:hypothetical protein
LPVGYVHGKFKFVNSFAEIISLFKDSGGVFTTKEYTKILERTKMAFDLSVTIDWLVIPHGVSSKKLTKSRIHTNRIAKIAIKVNNSFNVNCISRRK